MEMSSMPMRFALEFIRVEICTSIDVGSIMPGGLGHIQPGATRWVRIEK